MFIDHDENTIPIGVNEVQQLKRQKRNSVCDCDIVFSVSISPAYNASNVCKYECEDKGCCLYTTAKYVKTSYLVNDNIFCYCRRPLLNSYYGFICA